MKKLFLTFTLLIASLSSYSYEFTSSGDSHIETRKSDGRKVLFINGDTAKDLYTDLLSREDYVESVLGSNRPTEGAKELRHVDDYFGEWLCMDLTTIKNKDLMKHFKSSNFCRIIVNPGKE